MLTIATATAPFNLEVIMATRRFQPVIRWSVALLSRSGVVARLVPGHRP
jgi:hypothetical protein